MASVLTAGVLLEPQLRSDVPGLATSLILNVLARIAVLATGIVLLKRSPRAQLLAVVSMGVVFVTAAVDIALYASDVSRPTSRISVLVGSLIALGALATLLMVTLVHLRRPSVREEFDACRPDPVAIA